MKNLESLGQEVARQQDHRLEANRTAERAVAGLSWDDEAPTPRRWWPALAVAASLLFVVALAALLRRDAPLAIETAEVAPDTWISADAERPVAFSDGSTLLLQRGARFRITRLTGTGALVTLERGHATVSVPHRDDTRWTFDVGPFAVQVVGTRFDTGWEPGAQTFSLTMHDGAVRLTGPGIDGTRQVVAGQTVSLSLAPSSVEPPPAPPEDAPAAPAAPKGPSWKVLATRGEYPAALQHARRSGLDRILSTGSADELLLLGDVARFAKEPAVATQAWEAARRRFPRTKASTSAAFFLGRQAFEAGQPAAAKTWFSRYREEAPRGPFAAEALGRQLELANTSDPTLARALAREYLDAWPEGPHSRLAKAVLDR